MSDLVMSDLRYSGLTALHKRSFFLQESRMHNNRSLVMYQRILDKMEVGFR